MKLQNKTTRLQSAQAFTLAEVVIAIAVVSIMFVSLYSGISAGFGLINSARQNLRATQVALEKMETMRMYSWEQINSNSFVPQTFTAPFFPMTLSGGQTNSGGLTYYGTTVLTNAGLTNSYNLDTRLVIVTVKWTNGHAGFTREMRTMVSQYGMQRYIF
jgi:prepilin-type N-terminal cleavage/methylation domain-containing protein